MIIVKCLCQSDFEAIKYLKIYENLLNLDIIQEINQKKLVFTSATLNIFQLYSNNEPQKLDQSFLLMVIFEDKINYLQ